MALVFLLTVVLPGGGRTGHLSKVRPALPEKVLVHSGEFYQGSTRRQIDRAVKLCVAHGGTGSRCRSPMFIAETPRRIVRTSAYWISTTAVTTTDFEACVRAGACAPRSGHRADPRFDAPRLPVTDVTWFDASAFCRWRKGRLPTEAEWERAARGPAERTFPWGMYWNNALANHGQLWPPTFDDSDGHRYLAPVDSYPASRSPFGALNMAGNVWEWVADWYAIDAYYDQDRSNPTGPSAGNMRVVRGGSWASPPHSVRVTSRSRAAQKSRSFEVGFRCAWDG